MPPATGTDASAPTALLPTTSRPAAAPTSGPSQRPAPATPGVSAFSSLTFRIFLGTAVAIAAVLGVALLTTWISAQRAADAAIDRALRATTKEIAAQLRAQQEQMTAQARVFVASPDFRAEVEKPDRVESGTMLDQAQVAQGQLGASWVQLTDSAGVLLAKSDEPAVPQRDLSGSPLVLAALAGEEAVAFGVSGDTALIQLTAVPVQGASKRVIGVLMAARVVDNKIAATIGASTGSEIVMFALDRTKRPRVVGATSGLDRHQLALRPALEQGRSGSEMMGALMNEPTDTSGFHRADVTIDGERYVGAGQPLRTSSDALTGGFIALRSRAAEMATFDRLRTTILLAALAGFLVAFGLSAVVARQIARPVRALADATRRAADGDYEAELPPSGSDEIGALAGAFRRLLADLRDKQSLVDFLQSATAAGTQALAAGRTVPIRPVTPTMQAAVMGTGNVLEPGQLLANRYEVKSVLGVGGMGMVYRAMDRELGDVVAIKTLRPEMVAQDPAALERFKSEIRLARRISHRNVVRTHDLGETGGLYYITMELVEGQSLKDLITARGRLPVAVVLPIAKQLCRALEVAHEEGVIHRDIKPQNMVVEQSGVLKVMDFGIARLAQRTTGHTQAGVVVGTPEYMAPEQLVGDDLDARADLYAVGVVLYECLTGRVPLTADSVLTLIARVLEETPASLAVVQPDVPAPLSDLVMRALAKDRDQRPRSAAEMHAVLDRLG